MADKTNKTKLTPEQRAENARRNGAKSKGPVTPEGKARSARNALTHGLYAAAATVLPEEQPDLFNEFHDALVEAFAPVGTREQLLVTDIVSLRWRLTRVVRMETTAIVTARARQRKAVDEEFENVSEALRITLAFTGLDGNNSLRGFNLIGRTEARLSRMLHRTTAELDQLQLTRRQQEASQTGLSPAADVPPANSSNSPERPARPAPPSTQPEILKPAAVPQLRCRNHSPEPDKKVQKRTHCIVPTIPRRYLLKLRKTKHSSV